MVHEDQNNGNEAETVTGGKSTPDSSIPKLDRLGVFRIEKTLSSGGGGTVYLAFDESIKRRVALKVLHPSLSITEKAQKRFAREAWIAGQLEHQNIIKVYSRGEENQLNYIVMEFAEGGSLSDYIKLLREESAKSKDASITANREHVKSIVTKFIELAGALEYIHSKGFIHRDIKPHNILMAGNEKKFKLTDFGIAHAEDMTRFTKAGDFFGTIHYMSPEQITAHRTTVDKRTDVYSLGVTLYETLTLSLPFEGDSEEKLIGEIISGHYIPARKRLRSIPKDLETILMKAAHHDASRRYQSSKDFAEDLQRFIVLKPIVARPDGIFYKTGKNLSLKKRVNQVALAVILIVVAGVIVITKIQQDKYDKEKILTTLKHAVETKTSPFDFEPEWPRLSKKLYEHLLHNGKDSTLIWYFKANTITVIDYRQYATIDKAGLTAFLGGIKIFENDEQTDDLYVAQSTSWELAIDTLPYMPFAHEEVTYNGIDRGGIAHSFLFKESSVKTSGTCRVYLRTIIRHCVGSKLYLRSTKFKNSNWDPIEENWVKPQVIVSSTGDSLLEVKLGNAMGGSWQDYAETNNYSIRILDTSSLQITVPTFIDTIIDTMSFFIYDEYPQDFPRQIVLFGNNSSINDSVSISRVRLVKDNKGEFRTQIDARIPDSLRVPIAGDFQIIDLQSSAEIFSGKLRICRPLFLQFDVAYGESIASLHIISKGDNETEFESRTHEAIISELTFDNLLRKGEIIAEMKVIPSIEAARLFGDVYEFWGDTLKYRILFQAIDSAKMD